MMIDPTPTRSTLLRLLTEACELEHGLACSYMFAAMSLRQEPAGAIFPPEKLPLARQWASQIYFVASQEMLHLAQAWNLVVALGGSPYGLRPNFPQNTKYYPLHMRLALEPFGEAAIDRFIGYETPSDPLPEHAHFAAMTKSDDGDFRTIGELYGLIEGGIKALPNAIIGDSIDQAGPDLIDFPDIIRVVDVPSAVRAIQMITHQGEGNQTDRADCHFGIFLKLRDELAREKTLNARFSPAYPTIENPATDTSEEYGAPHATLIENLETRAVARAFDGLYSLMLRMLTYAFTPRGEPRLKRAFGQLAILMMVTVLKPFGEALVQMPARDLADLRNAGPTFGLTRHVIFSADPNAARILAAERLAELAAEVARLAASPGAPATLARVDAALRRLSGFDLEAPVLNGPFQSAARGGHRMPV